ncbi:MAG: acyltransferase family protein [Oscillospiraceae bacterium]
MEKRAFTKNDTMVIKGVAILMMLFHHLYLDASRYKGFAVDIAPFSKGLLTHTAQFGKLCVGIFLFLSAYGMTVSYKRMNAQYEFDRQTCGKSIAGRCLSMFSGYLFIFAIGIIGSVILKPEMLDIYGTGVKAGMYTLIDLLGLAYAFDTPTLLGTWWYMSLAYSLVVLLPVLLLLYRKLGILAVSLLWLVGCRTVGGGEYNEICRWMFIGIIGLYFADRDLLPKIRAFLLGGESRYRVLFGAVSFLLLSVLLFGMLDFRHKVGDNLIDVFDCAAVVAIVLFGYTFLSAVRYLNTALVFLGKYSMNIFLFHSFIRIKWFNEFTYSFKYWWLIYLVLLADSLIAAILIDLLKKLTRYDKLTGFLLKRIRS